MANTQPGGTPEAWNRAREIVSQLGRVPPIFTTPIRTLMLDHQAGKEQLTAASQFLVNRLLRAPSITAPFYYATITYHGERVSNIAYLSSMEMIRLYAADELAALLGLIYCHGRIMKQGKLEDNERWFGISRQMHRKLEIGVHLGYGIPKIGVAKGMFASTLRYLAMGLFLIEDQNDFQEYKEHLTNTRQWCDLKWEIDRWGCTNVDVAANLIQLLGFGISMAHSYSTAIGAGKCPNREANEEAYQFYLADEWLHALLEGRDEPERKHLGEYYPLEKARHKMLYEVSQIREQGSRHSWLEKTKEHINPSDTPQLFQEYLLELQQSSAIEEFYKDNLPDEILDELSEEELQELSSTEKGQELFPDSA